MDIADVAGWLRNDAARQRNLGQGDGKWLDAMAEVCERLTWRPIESAPKDGSRVLLSCPNERAHLVIGWWDNGVAYGFSPSLRDGFFEDDYSVLDPDRWMPLPESPK